MGGSKALFCGFRRGRWIILEEALGFVARPDLRKCSLGYQLARADEPVIKSSDKLGI